MIIYGDERRQENTQQLIEQLRKGIAAVQSSDKTSASELRDLLIMAGELEQGIADAAADNLLPREQAALRSLCRWLGAALACQGNSNGVRERLRKAERALKWLAKNSTTTEVQISTPEGYAYYALYTEQYQAATEELVRTMPPGKILVIGVRSIGTSLAGAVEGTLREMGRASISFTVRPTGHPFERTLDFSPEQRRFIEINTGGYFLVIDEGPGMSGSSLAAVGAALLAEGTPANRIVFMPGHGNGPGQEAKEEIRHIWAKVNVRPAHPHDLFALPDLARLREGSSVETSPFSGPDYSPFARISFLLRGEHQHLLSYAGLGSTGHRALAWAWSLRANDLITSEIELADGFLVSEWCGDTPLVEAADVAERVAQLIDLASRQEPQPCPTLEKWLEMIYWNTWEALGESVAERTRVLWQSPWREALVSNSPSAIYVGYNPSDWYSSDGRLLLRQPLSGLNGHTFTNVGGTAWHLAAFQAGWEQPDEWAAQISAHLQHAAPPTAQELLCARIAYAAYGVGLAKTCGTQSSTPDYWWQCYDQHKTKLAECLESVADHEYGTNTRMG